MGIELAKVWVNVRANDEGMHRDLNKTEGSLTRRAMRMGGGLGAAMFSPVGGALAAAGAALGVGLIAKTGMELAATAEQTEIAFETMLGSADAAKKMMMDLSQFAAKTPFDMPGISKSAKILMAFGTQQAEVIPTLKALGDISAGTGKPLNELSVIFGQIKAKGRLMGQEMMQLREAGLNIGPILAKQFGVAESAIEGMITKGQISFKDVETAMFSMSAAGGQFHNLMEKQSKSVGGLWSTLKDSIGLTLTRIFTILSPITKFILNFSINIANWVLGALDKISDRALAFTQSIADWLTVLTQNWGTAWELVKTSTMLALSSMLDGIKNMVFAVPGFFVDAWKFVSSNFIKFATWLGEAFYKLIKSIGDFAWKLFNVFKAVFKGIEEMWLALFTGDSMSAAWKRAKKKVTDSLDKEFGIKFGQAEFDEAGGAGESERTKALRKERDALLAQLKGQVDALAAGRAAEGAGAGAMPGGPAAAAPAQLAAIEAGRIGFAELGQKIQDSFLKKDGDKQGQMVDLLALGNKKQDELIAVTKQNATRPGLLT